MTTSIDNQLKEAVREAQGNGWSLLSLATAAGARRSSVREWLREGTELKSSDVAALAAFFGMRLTKPRIPKPPERSGA